jgi:hypothetical protein
MIFARMKYIAIEPKSDTSHDSLLRSSPEKDFFSFWLFLVSPLFPDVTARCLYAWTSDHH